MKKYIKVLFFGIFVFINTGCVHKTIPKNNISFKVLKDIKQMNGCYINLAESTAEYKKYLSTSLYFRGKIKPDEIKFICLKVQDDMRLRIVAKKNNNKILQIKILTNGKDFMLKSGKLSLYDKTSFSGDNVAGVANEYSILGIDEKYNLKMVKGYRGIIVLPIPFMLIGSDTYRFRRVVE